MNTVLANGMSIPKIGLGVWGTNGEEAAHAVECALKCGYRHIDTAAFYKNEEQVAEGIRRSGVAREDIVIATKVWFDDMIDEASVRKACQQSLEKLETDYIDLYILHWPLNNYVESWKALEKLYEEGKVRAIGVSNFQRHHMEELLKAAKIKPMVNQIEIHPTFGQTELVEYCQEKGIMVEAWGPLGKGADLTNEAIGTIADKYEKTPAQIILRWHLQRDTLIIPKSVTESRIISNRDIFDFELTEEDMAVITAQETHKTNRGYMEDYTWE